MDCQNRIAFLNQQIEKMKKERDELIRLEQAQHETRTQRKPQSVYEKNWEQVCSELMDAYEDGEGLFLNRRICSDTQTTKLFFDFSISPKKYLVLEHMLKLPYQTDSGKRFCPCSLVVIKHWKGSLVCKQEPYLTATDLRNIAGCSVEKLLQENKTFQNLYQEIREEAYEDLKRQIDEAQFNDEMSWCGIYPLSTPILLKAGLQDKNWGRTGEFMIVGVILHETPLY